jgi:cytochrome c peroxidase
MLFNPESRATAGGFHRNLRRAVSVRSLRALIVFTGLGLAAAAGAELALPIPDAVLPPEIPADNPPTEAKVELGKKLYFDARLSSDGSVACATCHAPQSGFADPRGKPTSAGVGGQLGTRNSPTTLNALFLSAQFWDGRAATLEEQSLQPFINPVEMGIADHAALVAKLSALAEYGPLFQKAFGSQEVTAARIGQALASFERTLVALAAPIDRYLAGEQTAISDSAKRGWALFNGKARCNTCHGWVEAFPLFTDELYHNIGVGVKNVDFAAIAARAAQATTPEQIDALALQDAEASELGRYLVSREQKDIGAFKTPQLRNVDRTAPYMHDGSQATLADVIEFYDKGGETNPYLDGGIRPLALTTPEKADLVELMKTFTSTDLDRFREWVRLMPQQAGK